MAPRVPCRHLENKRSMRQHASRLAGNTTYECICTPNTEDKLLSLLKKDPRLAHRELHCQTEPGRIILRGRVCSFFEKQIAQEILRRMEGVGQIQNELEVRPEPPTGFFGCEAFPEAEEVCPDWSSS